MTPFLYFLRTQTGLIRLGITDNPQQARSIATDWRREHPGQRGELLQCGVVRLTGGPGLRVERSE